MKRFEKFLVVLAILIAGLMALGAGVRTMKAGLSCPDWPLCFGKIIPDFHVGVWFEFTHRAYAGIVSLLFIGALIYALRSKTVPVAAKRAAKWGFVFLAVQIIMGGLTVLKLVQAQIVTSHLLLATLFFSSVLWMLFAVHQEIKGKTTQILPQGLRRVLFLLPLSVFIQIAIGGMVASTYAGSVCVDWPLCNGQWVPTWKGAIGLQIIHRFVAYALAIVFLALSVWAYRANLFKRLFVANAVIVFLQVGVGIANLMLFIPPHVTVFHQTLAMLLLAVNLRIWFKGRPSNA